MILAPGFTVAANTLGLHPYSRVTDGGGIGLGQSITVFLATASTAFIRD